jgi:hypothetical protein
MQGENSKNPSINKIPFLFGDELYLILLLISFIFA